MDRVELIIELKGDKAALNSLRELQNLANQLNNKKINIDVSGSNINTLKGRLSDLAGKLRDVMSGDNKLNIDSSGIDRANDAVSNLKANVSGLSEIFGGLSTAMSGIGGALSSAGTMLSSLSGMFGGNILGTVSRTLTGYATIMGVQGLGKAADRFDVFRTFPKFMEAMGFSAEDAAAAVERMNQSVLGLSTPLDEIVHAAQTYIMLTNDLDKGTSLAIALNNAILAGGADSQQVNKSLSQIRDLLAVGGLKDTEWDSLFKGLGISARYIGEELGYSADQTAEFLKAMKNGDVAAEDFIDALIRAGTGTGELVNLTNITKDTVEASTTNLKTAFANLGASVLDEFDKLLKDRNGEGLPAWIKSISDSIKTDLIPSVRGWVSENGDAIIDFLDKLIHFDWGKLLTSIGDNAMSLFGIIGKVLEAIGEDNLIKFISFATVWAGPLGTALKLFGSAFGAVGGLFEWLSRIAGQSVSGGTSGILGAVGGGGLISTSLLGMLAEVGFALKQYAEAFDTLSNVNIENVVKALPALTELLIGAAEIAGIATGVGAVASLIPGGTGAIAIGELLGAGFIGILAEIGFALGQYAGSLETLATLNNMELPSKERLVEFGELLGEFGKSVSQYLNGVSIDRHIGESISNLLTAIATIAANEDAYRDIMNSDLDFKAIADKLVVVLDGLGRISNEFRQAFETGGGLATLITTWAQGGIVDNMNTVANNLNESIYALKKIKDDIANLGVLVTTDGEMQENSPFATLIKQIDALIIGLGEISDTFHDAFAYGGDFMSRWVTSMQGDTIENMNTIIDDLNVSITKLKDIETSLNGFVTGLEGTDDYSNLVSKIKELITGLGEISSTISGDWASSVSTAFKSFNETKILENYDEAITSMKEMVDTLGSFEFTYTGEELFAVKENIIKVLLVVQEILETISGAWYDWIPFIESKSGGQRSNTENMSIAIEMIKGILENISSITGSLSNIDDATLSEFESRVTKAIGAVQNILSEIAAPSNGIWESVDNLEAKTQAVESLAVLINKIKVAIQRVSDMQELISAITENDTLGSAEAIFSKLNEIIENYFPEDTDDILERVNAFNEIVTIIGGIIETTAQMQERIAEIMEGGDLEEGASSILDRLAKIIGGFADDEDLDTDKFTILAESVTLLDETIVTFIDGTYASLMQALLDLEANIIELTETILENLRAKMYECQQQTEQLDAAIDDLGDACEEATPKVEGLTASIDELAGTAAEAAGQVSELAAAINSLQDKTVTLTVNTVQAMGSVLGATNPLIPGGYGSIRGEANGGLIYRAVGGGVFKPRGTDTVPAMLTPGEFVIRKKAVDAIGAPILQMLNRMDISKAIDALMSRVHVPLNGGIVNYDNRRTYDNHATVNQTIYTDNPGFTYRRASRFAHAL